MYMQTHEQTMSTESATNSTGTKLKTRFGEISYQEEKIVAFPNGILGMPGQTSFAIAEMPIEKLKNFQVLQSLVDDETSFAILPHDFMEEKIEQNDIEEICDILEINRADALVFLIASVKKTAERTTLTVNMRAPLFVDVENKQGFQIVMTSNKYQVQHEIS